MKRSLSRMLRKAFPNRELELTRRKARAPKFDRDGDLVKLTPTARALAGQLGIVPEIHADDYIFNTLYVLSDKDMEKAFHSYYANGRVSATNVRSLVDFLSNHYLLRNDFASSPLKILDFASGYGGVTRHLPVVFPGSFPHAIDIHDKSVRFIETVLGTPSTLSQSVPEALKVDRQFDLVFAISFFSHVPKARFLPWLKKLSELVAVDGLLIFTTHGEVSHRTQMSHVRLSKDGFGFIRTSEQFDIPLDDYMHVITYPGFVARQLESLPHMDQLMFIKGFWWQHQDVYVWRKLR